METRYRTFKEFYPYYLQEHANRTCRRLHFAGSCIVLLLLAMAMVTGELALLWLLPVVGYGFAWAGHFFFEHNRPATFKYPLFSLMGDWVMFRDMLAGRVAW
ncbi:DUF962 domain-containing protein [Duganella sp. Root198D2]|uniref:DUF962 domain-containing protein n=1 Tax=Duganella sp. Root198D2 TaxID=1736489 RepID=UPI00070D26FF|nr:DUF962 domain-containing protein [Duganella sp. Root198D2]KRB95840.1 hypothetical protein ASE26_26145 [Duganella sp. Root198D2]